MAAHPWGSPDGAVLGLAASERRKRVTRFLVAAEFLKGRWFSWALRRFEQIPVRRGTRDTTALETAITTVRGGAPRGARSRSSRRVSTTRRTTSSGSWTR